MRSRSIARAATAATLAALVAGCGARVAPPATPPPQADAARPTRVAPVADDAFAASLHALLRDGSPSPERSVRLASVVARQLAHAEERFALKDGARGLASVAGAAYLVRAGEARAEMFTDADRALAEALRRVAQRGDEGRALALLDLRAMGAAPGTPARDDIDGHLAALRSWLQATSADDTLEAAGRTERVQAQRALLEPTAEARKAAREATLAWIDRATALHEGGGPPHGRARREDAIEAYRALRSGAQTLAALSLRDGDASAALADVDHGATRRIVSPLLYAALERAGSGGDAGAWRALLGTLAEPSRSAGPAPRGGDEEPELQIAPELLRAAVFGVAVEAFRVDPTSLEVAVTLAGELARVGLPEALPLVLADAVEPRADPASVGAALGLVAETMAREDENDDAASARRVYEAARRLLDRAARPDLAGRVRPSPARLALLMGAIDVRVGDLAAARPLLEQASAAEPTAEALSSLATLARQADDRARALALYARAAEMAAAQGDLLGAADAHLAACDVRLDERAGDAAREALVLALRGALAARAKASAPSARVRAEVLLARVLERFGERAGAARATDRAHDAAGRDRALVAHATLDAAARAYVRGDAAAARRAVARASDAEVGDDDLVYAALWLTLAERDRKPSTDGVAGRALASIRDDGSFSGKLAAWGLGRTKDADLLASARTPTQRAEAAFYIAAAQRVAGDATLADAALRDVVRSPQVDLVEVQIARDLLRGAARIVPGGVPAGLAIP